MKTIMGIDQSLTSTGIVIVNGIDVIHSEVICSIKTDNTYKRITDISIRCLDLANKFKPNDIVIEGLAFGSFGKATRDLAGLHFVIASLLLLNQHKVHVIPPTQLKKLATGHGKASKKDMYASLPSHIKDYFVNKKFKTTSGLYDVTDAYFLATCLAVSIT